ncbi:MAG TPA: hypothetical protein PLD20_33270 [Blastocatellia bacterium]|nr:hypothetical protein [Blastocatellia bacterium]HMV84631.1 hypothetical protein [Blastocatellia bacterium]HMX29535.1 hypothetical protein [Blastocatellia bacterium]HMY72863.1 hypothetical protein [Blastocatellia bacterium]HMZ22844.1 hypothetical protein [Blastocatellia bacterium]
MYNINFGKTANTVITAFFTFFLCLGATAQDKIPKFKDYPVTEVYHGPVAQLVLTKDDLMFRTRLKEAAKEKPNFAGNYILTFWGCGTECVMGAMIDAKTGKVYWLPSSLCCWGTLVDDKFSPIEYRLNSKLLVLSGERNEKEGDNGAHFYKFENGTFTHIKSIMKK